MVDKMGGLSFLQFPDRGPDRDAFLEQVLTGWKRQQFTKNFTEKTVKRRIASVVGFAEFSGKFPWEWTPRDADDYFAHLRGVKNLSQETARAYQSDISLFCAYATSDIYQWNETCGRMFGTSMSQVITDLNKAKHTQEATMGPEKRAFDMAELQDFFDLADDEVERILRSRRKGGLAAWRDAVALKVVYGWGLRHDEMRKLDLVDFSRSAKAPYFGDYGIVRVRNGKSNKGAPKKQRSVLTLVDWAAEAVADWVENGLPRFGQPMTHLFPTSTGGVVAENDLLLRFQGYVKELGLEPGLDIHGLRRSYATHMITVYGYDEKFISMQLGHVNTSTTTIYTLPSADFAVKEMERVLTKDMLNSRGSLLLKPKRSTGKVAR
ncbi:site-specific recombinase XerD [Aurantimicrobium minutum]|uniref:site-specific integrase n=1 Tax=Aurantimicrobium minutum TaxID=708131 RepID=UPI002473D735|nr:site-specific integrase [Aurantimicrobium minutum]MDH6532951.1 site-specific recombinase XerD [Aurantimicrobium minutum]